MEFIKPNEKQLEILLESIRLLQKTEDELIIKTTCDLIRSLIHPPITIKAGEQFA